MIILKMKLKGNKIYIKVSGGDVFSIPKNSIYELNLYEGMELEYDEIPHIRLRAFEASARKNALQILKRGFISEGMLRYKLIKKGVKRRFINYAIEYCKEYDLIDDKRFVKIAVNSLKLKGKSKRYIIDYLRKCNIKKHLINRINISDKIDEKSLKEAIKKYYRVYEHKDKKEDYIIKTLLRKGFKYDRIKTLLKKYMKHFDKE